MLREVDMNQISDGRTYGLNDMVKAETSSCAGCHKCCTGMGTSIVLDPYDIWQLKQALGKSFEELLGLGYIELNMVDGLILPNLKMNEKDCCSFLNAEGRCSVHQARPGICRLFPLGRVYDGTGFQYFLQTGQCAKGNLAKVKVKKWIDTANVSENQEFITTWHYFIRRMGEKNVDLRDKGMGDKVNEVAMYVLNEFFVKDFSDIDNSAEDKDCQVYALIQENVKNAEKMLSVIG